MSKIKKRWRVYLPSFAFRHWKKWTGKTCKMWWCCGDCLLNPMWKREVK